MSIPIKEQKFINPATGRTINFWRAKYLGLLTPDQSRQAGGDSPSSIPPSEFKVETVKIKDLHFDPKIFIPMKTGNSQLDKFVSSDGGFMPATNIIIIGTPGIGKTTISLEFLSRVKAKGKKVLFISGEMQRIDMYRYCKRFKKFAELDILFTSDYSKSDPRMAIEKALQEGYDMVLIDSWAEVANTVRDVSGWSMKKTESWILDIMEKHNEGKNDGGLYACFLVVQQVTKNGVFLGSNRLKHMTSGMLDMYKDRENERNIMEFSKNRVGTAGQSVSFRINTGTINFASVND
jgi:DNA repair protein RadA/Sms